MLAARSALAQTRAPEQVIVLCDGCTDGTVEALREIGDERVEVLDLPKLPGFAYAHRNIAIERARGDVVTWLADDDLLLPDHLERAAEYWDDDAADIVAAPAVIVHPDDRLEWIGEDWGVPRLRADMFRDNTNVMASVSVRVSTARAVGGWDAAVPRAADWALWRACLDAGARPAATIEPTVLHFRAAGRDQAWVDRVRQNREWFARLGDPDALRELRRTLRRTRALRAAARLDAIDAATIARDELAASHAEAARRAGSLADALERVERELEDLRRADDALHEERDALWEDREALREDRDAARAMLDRIYTGRWWRLRGRLRAIARLGRRG